MKTIAYLFKIFVICLSVFLISCNQPTQFSLLDGSRHSEADYSGQWLVINFWAEWCSPCLEEVPELNKLSAQGAELNLSVLGISYDQLSNHELNLIVKKWNILYPVIAAEPIPVLSFDLPQTLPTNYIISPEGKVVKILVGKQTVTSLKNALSILKSNYKN